MITVTERTGAATETILQLAGGAALSRCLHAVANIGVADAGAWGELARNPEASRIFDDAMTAKAHGR